MNAELFSAQPLLLQRIQHYEFSINKGGHIMNRKNTGVIFFATLLILLGAALLCFSVFGWVIKWPSGWWTFILMALAVLSMARRGLRFGNTLLLGSAVIMFARWQGFLIRTWWQMGASICALALVLAGISLIWHMLRPRKAEPSAYGHGEPAPGGAYTQPPPPQRESGAPQAADGEANPSRFALFSSETCRCDCKALQSGRFTAIFGGVLVDLRQADFVRPVTVDVYNIFGGVDIFVPPGVRVECAGTSIFGGCDAKAVAGRPYDPAHPPLTIRHVSVFGGVNVQ
jgi:predicted membrane protein